MTVFRRLLLLLPLVLLLSLGLMACGGGEPVAPGQTIYMGIVPKESPEKTRQDFEGFVEYLRDATGLDIWYVVPTDYTAVVVAMAGGTLDLSLFGAVTYIQVSNQAPVHPLVKGVIGGSDTYHSVIITRVESDIHSMDDLRGRTFAFGDVSSTSGHLTPHLGLLEAGIDPTRDFATEPVYTGAHNATALAVYNGSVDAGAMEEPVLVNMVEQGLLDMSQIRIVWRSGPIPQYPWVVRDGLDPKVEEELLQAFLSAPRQVIPPTVAESFVGASEGDYAEIRRAAEQLGLAGVMQ